jgi:predicted DNA-binding transcriptional regulator YafY
MDQQRGPAASDQLRLQILKSIKRLSQHHVWVTIQQIVDYLNEQGYEVEKHNVRRGLSRLMALHPDLVCNDNSKDGLPTRGTTYGYKWTGPALPPDIGLSIPEALSLTLVKQHLKHALPHTLVGSLDSLFSQAENTLELQSKSAEARWSNKTCVIPPTQPLLPPNISIEILNCIHEALLHDEQLEVKYQNNQGVQKQMTLHPLGLMLREPSGYLIAISDQHEEPRQYALHRFKYAKRSFLPCRKPDGFNFSDYISKHGHFGTGDTILLEAKVNGHLRMILTETPMGKDQVLTEVSESGWSKLSVTVQDTWQLRWWILSQGDRMVVLSPYPIVHHVVQTIGSVCQLYKENEIIIN